MDKDDKMSIKRQCELLGVCRSSFYYIPRQEGSDNQELMKLIDKQYMKTPFLWGTSDDRVFTGIWPWGKPQAHTASVPVNGVTCYRATSQYK